MQSMDDLLAQLKAEYEEKDNPQKLPKQQPLPIESSPQITVVQSHQTTQVSRTTSFLSRSEEQLLADIRSEFEQQEKAEGLTSQQQSQAEQRQVKLSPQLPVLPNYQTQVSRTTSFLSRSEEQLLTDVKSELAEQDKAAELKRQQQLQEEQRRQEQIKQQQKQALIQEAEAWLKKLKPRSEEGLWFEEFAYSYPSKLEAAIDYLQALKEVQS
jgi:hypothetical protein